MKKAIKNPRPTITHEGSTYCLKSHKIEVPDFSKMESLHILLWINKNTTPRGRMKAENPLAGMSGAIKAN